MNSDSRLTTTYYRSFAVFIIVPLLVFIAIAFGFLRSNTLNASRDRITLAQNSIIAALLQDVNNAVRQFEHLLQTGDGRLLELSSRILLPIGQSNLEAEAEMLGLYNLIIPPNSDIAAVHFYATNGRSFCIGEPLSQGVSVVRDLRHMNFYRNAVNAPGRISVDFIPPGVINLQPGAPEQPFIVVSFAAANNNPAGLTEMISLFMPTRAHEMLRSLTLAPGNGTIYLIDEYGEIIMHPSDTPNTEHPRIPEHIPWMNGTHSVSLPEGRFDCIVRIIEDDWESDWKLLTLISESVMFSQFNTLAMIVIIISAILLLSYFLFSRNFLKNIIKPLNNLMNGMEEMQQNMENPDVKVNVEPVGQQEMRELIESFNYMTSAIDDLMRMKEGIFKASPVGLIMFDDEYDCIDCNETILEMFNVTKTYYLANYRNLSPEYQEDGAKSKDKFTEIMKWALNGEEVVTEWLFMSPSDEQIPCEITLARTERGGKYVGLGFVYDLRSVKRMMENIQFLESEVDKIYYDGLTGIYNRRYLDKHLDMTIKSLSRSPSGMLSLLMIDIDCFKPYNDTYGHSQGDECLKIVASTLKEAVTRADDFVVRYGGEEFCVVLPTTDVNGACVIAELLVENIRKRWIPHEATKVEGVDYVTISVGVTTGDVHYTQTADDYIKQADAMLYHSKKSGRNRYTFGAMPQPAPTSFPED